MTEAIAVPQPPIELVTVGLVSLNVVLALGFFTLAWLTHRLRQQVNQWERAIAQADQQLAVVLAASPRYLAEQTDALQQLRQTYHTWQVALNRLQQAIVILRFLLIQTRRF